MDAGTATTDDERARIIAMEATNNELVLCKIRIGELRDTMRMSQTGYRAMANELHSALARKARLTTLLRTGTQPVEPNGAA